MPACIRVNPAVSHSSGKSVTFSKTRLDKNVKYVAHRICINTEATAKFRRCRLGDKIACRTGNCGVNGYSIVYKAERVQMWVE